MTQSSPILHYWLILLLLRRGPERQRQTRGNKLPPAFTDDILAALREVN